MIEIKGAYKSLGDKEVLSDINFNIEKGSICGLIGPNGAGKTTLIKCITGIYRLDKGSIKINNQPVFENLKVKELMGYVADENNYFKNFTVKDIIKFYALSYERFDIKRFQNLNKVFEIPKKIPVSKLSKGMKMRLAIMINLSIKPEVLILDEPTAGLDPIVKKQTLNILLEDVAERGTTILISSHNLMDLERFCDSIAIINKGNIKYTSSIENMKRNIRKVQVVFSDEVPKDLKYWDEIIKVEQVGRVYNIITRNYSDDFKNKLNDCGILFQEEIDLSLEDMFIYSMGGEVNYEQVF